MVKQLKQKKKLISEDEDCLTPSTQRRKILSESEDEQGNCY